MTNTATSVNITLMLLTEQKSNNITFKDKAHEKFYYMYLSKCMPQDVIPQVIDILTIKSDKISHYFADTYSNEEIEGIIC